MTQEKFFKRYKYSIRTDKIGGGTFGTVYKAYDDVLDRTVAIKVSEVKVIDSKEFSLQNEFEALKGLKPHKNIANYQELHTFEMHNGIFDYAIMQYYKDGNLSAFIKANPKLEKEQIAIYLLEGIEHLHNNKVVHRDLKPSNVLIVKKGTEIIPKITDFGLSKKADPNAKSRFTNSFGGGTLMYSSPEQLKGKKLRFNTDLWSYGVIIYELLTGNKLFENIKSTNSLVDSDIEIIKQINSKDLTNCILELPEKWQAVGKACLERNPEKRVQNSEGIKRILKEGILETKDVQEEETTILDIAESKEDVKNYIDKERQAKPKKEGNTTIKKNTKWLVFALLFLATIGLFKNAINKIEQKKKEAKRQKEKERIEIEKNSPKMIRVAGGTFTMGDEYGIGYDDEQPTHSVTLSSYYIGKTEVTVAQYRYYCRATGVSMPEEPSWGWNDKNSILNVSWNDAIKYCKWLSKKLGKNITLPTEAQWEFAARGGNKSRGYKYSGSNSLDAVAWHDGNSNNKTHNVAQKKANELGLYDISGNVWGEWCLDWYNSDYYSNSPNRNPQGPSSGNRKVLRGGSWYDGASYYCRVAYRNYGSPDYRDYDFGFRVVSF